MFRESKDKKQNIRLMLILLMCVLLAGVSGVFGINTTDFQANINSLNSQSFPYIYLNIQATNNSEYITNLTQSDFLCTENNEIQNDSFLVTPPAVGGSVRMADIVFLIDTSGSMGSAITGVKDNVMAFADNLSTSSINYRLGLVQFGQSAYSGSPLLLNNATLTSDSEAFKNLVSTLYASGGYEPGFLALRMAAQGFNFRPGAQKIFVIITDEDSDERNKQDTIDLMVANDIIVHTAPNCNAYYGYSKSDYCDNTSVRAATGGTLFSVQGPYDAILETIATQAASTYVVQYRSSNPVFDGVLRNVSCMLTYSGQQATVNDSYIPGSAPQIELTNETIILNGIALPDTTSNVTISAIVTDNVTPYVQLGGVKLHYRTAGTSAYSTIVMNEESGEYKAIIPIVQPPGVQYYITATDGQQTSSLPSYEPENNPFNIAVLPNVKPNITHTPVTSAIFNTTISIQAVITDNTTTLVNKTLYYRNVGELIYSELPMVNVGGDNYEAVIPSGEVSSDIEYYVSATDDYGLEATVGTSDSPILIVVQMEPTDFTLRLEAGLPYCDKGTNKPVVELKWTQALNVDYYKLFRNDNLHYPTNGSMYTGLTYEDSTNLEEGKNYTYYVKAVNSYGDTKSNNVRVNIPEGFCNNLPVADAGSDEIINTTNTSGTKVVLNASGSSDVDSTSGTNDDIVKFEWFENGSKLADGEVVEEVLSVGEHNIKLLVTDKQGATDDDYVKIKVVLESSPQPTCEPNVSTICYDDNVYWLDSCQNRGDLKEECQYGCSAGVCEPKPSEPPVNNETNTTNGTPILLDECQEISESGNYVLDGNVESEKTCFEITADNVYFDCDSYSLKGDGKGYGIDIKKAKNITIENCDISEFGRGINVKEVSYSNFINLNVFDNSLDAIRMSSLKDSNLDEINTYGNKHDGIYLKKVEDTIFKDVSSYDNEDDGIYVKEVKDSVFENVDVYNNKGDGINIKKSKNNYYEDISSHDNKDDGIYITESEKDEFFDVFSESNKGDGIRNKKCKENVFTNIESASNGHNGWYISESKDSTFTNINVHDNDDKNFYIKTDTNNVFN